MVETELFLSLSFHFYKVVLQAVGFHMEAL